MKVIVRTYSEETSVSAPLSLNFPSPHVEILTLILRHKVRNSISCAALWA